MRPQHNNNPTRAINDDCFETIPLDDPTASELLQHEQYSETPFVNERTPILSANNGPVRYETFQELLPPAQRTSWQHSMSHSFHQLGAYAKRNWPYLTLGAVIFALIVYGIYRACQGGESPDIVTTAIPEPSTKPVLSTTGFFSTTPTTIPNTTPDSTSASAPTTMPETTVLPDTTMPDTTPVTTTEATTTGLPPDERCVPPQAIPECCDEQLQWDCGARR